MNCRYFNFILILGRIKIVESPAAFDVDAHILPSVASILSLALDGAPVVILLNTARSELAVTHVH